jgi:hypothetical protein
MNAYFVMAAIHMKHVFGIFGILVLGSCSHVKLSERKVFYSAALVESAKTSNLSGIYANKADEAAVEGYSLWQNLFPDRKHNEGWERAIVDLKFSESDLFAKLIVDGDTIASRRIQYKIAQQSVSLHRQVASRFFAGPICWAIVDWKVLIATTIDDKQLVLSRAGNGALMIIVVPVFPAAGQVNYGYKRLT